MQRECERPLRSEPAGQPMLLGVKDMERSKRFYTEGLGWKIENDYGISVFFVPHGGSLIGFYGREGLANDVGLSPEGSG